MAGMTLLEIKKLVDRYIGVVGGNLGQTDEFSYRTLQGFYAEYCGLGYDIDKYTGTKRARFEAILRDAPPRHQAKIVLGILERHPPDPAIFASRTQALHDELKAVADRLDKEGSGVAVQLNFTSEVVEHAIQDAESLFHTRNATSGVDRVHTALHGYLRKLCDEAAIGYEAEATMPTLLKKLRTDHPAFKADVTRSQDITQILRSIGSVADALNPIRNNASVAHPNEELLDEPEAMLAINASKTILQYVDLRMKKHSAAEAASKFAPATIDDGDIPF